MQVFLLFIELLFLAFMTLFIIFALDSLLRGHDLATSKRTTKALIKIISRFNPEAKNFYDLGCARGGLSLNIKKNCPRLSVCGMDKSAIRIFFAELMALVLKQKVNFKKQDIFQTNLRNADIVYVYLWYDLTASLEKKLQKELKTGAVAITNTSNFPNWKPVEKIITYPKISKIPDFVTLFVYIKE